LIIHNIGNGTHAEDRIFDWKVLDIIVVFKKPLDANAAAWGDSAAGLIKIIGKDCQNAP
jgi:hypothetical protein